MTMRQGAPQRDPPLPRPGVVRAVIADGDALLRQRVARALEADGIHLAAQAHTSAELAAAVLGPPHVAIVAGDNHASVAEQAEAMSAVFPHSHRLAILRSDRPRAVQRMLRDGLSGIVLETHLEACLAATVHAVATGQIVFPPEVRRQISSTILSKRESQILGLIVLGLTNQEIASKLIVAESTVKTHVSSAFRKLGVNSRYEAAALITDPERPLARGILHLSDNR